MTLPNLPLRPEWDRLSDGEKANKLYDAVNTAWDSTLITFQQLKLLIDQAKNEAET